MVSFHFGSHICFQDASLQTVFRMGLFYYVPLYPYIYGVKKKLSNTINALCHFVLEFVCSNFCKQKKCDNLSSMTTETPIEKAVMLGEAFNNRVGGNGK